MRAVFLLCLVVLLSPSAQAADCTRTFSDNARFAQSELRLRSGPGQSNSTYAVLPRGQHVEVRANTGDWASVTVPALRLNGYVAARYLSLECIAGEELTRARLTDAQIAEILFARSRTSYAGSCPCPYNTDRAGRRCGARSAYSRPGGASPICYASDIRPAAIARFRTE